ncbi:MAG: SgcJ/EcaC family oxidoreductase [Bacteroidales bacterium]|nr:SgcJ/EcaC family oxidoreductase [Bacteroidales bacterium]
MKKYFSICLVAAATLTTACNPSNESAISEPTLADDSTAIVNLINGTYRDALAASNAGSVVAAYANDGVVMGPGAPTAVGSEALAATYSAIFDAVGLDLNFHIDQMLIGNRYAFVRSVSTGTATIGETEAREDNRELFIVERDSADWKIARYLYNKQDTYKAADSTAVTAVADAENTAADTAAVEALISTYQTALNASDAVAVAAVYTTDAVVMGPGAPTVSGNANVQQMYAQLFEGMTLNLTFHIDEVVLDGEYGFVRSHSDGDVTAGDATVPSSFRELFVVKKVDGEWKIAWYEYNQPNQQ